MQSSLIARRQEIEMVKVLLMVSALFISLGLLILPSDVDQKNNRKR